MHTPRVGGSLTAESVGLARATLPHDYQAHIEARHPIVKEVVTDTAKQVHVVGILSVQGFETEIARYKTLFTQAYKYIRDVRR